MSRAGTSFRTYLAEIGVNKNRANECDAGGQLLAKVERNAGGRPSENRPGSGQFRAYLAEIGVNKNRANECDAGGQLLAKVERNAGGRPSENRPGSGQFRAYLAEIGVNKNRANECERKSAKSVAQSGQLIADPRKRFSELYGGPAAKSAGGAQDQPIGPQEPAARR